MRSKNFEPCTAGRLTVTAWHLASILGLAECEVREKVPFKSSQWRQAAPRQRSSSTWRRPPTPRSPGQNLRRWSNRSTVLFPKVQQVMAVAVWPVGNFSLFLCQSQGCWRAGIYGVKLKVKLYKPWLHSSCTLLSLLSLALRFALDFVRFCVKFSLPSEFKVCLLCRKWDNFIYQVEKLA